MEIQHFLHKKHKLKRKEMHEDQGFICKMCEKLLSGQAYCCSDCCFYLHKLCAELPHEIQHFFHPCPLTLTHFSATFTCNACYQPRSCFTYHCKPCRFFMDIECVQFSTINSEGEDGLHIQHFSHPHPLTLIEEGKDCDVFCELCVELYSGPIYCCYKCKFYIHKSCMDILHQKVQHFSHPCPLTLLTTKLYLCDVCNKQSSGFTFHCGECNFHLCFHCSRAPTGNFDDLFELPSTIQHFHHPCPLILKPSPTFTCNACYGHHSGFTYHCENCYFDIDVECALLPTIDFNGEEDQIQHFSHCHRLTFFEKIENYEASCEICQKYCLGPTYACTQCNFYLHESCEEILHQKIECFSHPCFLTLLTTPSFQCDICFKACSGLTFRCGKCYYHLCIDCFRVLSELITDEIQHFLHPCPLVLRVCSAFTCNVCFENCSGFSYQCKRCNFDIDIKCSQLPTMESEGEDQNIIQHFSHQHPLTLFRNMEDDEIFCEICEMLCSGSTFGCFQCNFYLHKSCLNILNQEIQHFSHPCPLILLTTPSYQCNVCGENFSGLTFRCGKCYFHLCTNCFHTSCTLPREIQHFLHPCSLILRTSDFTCNVCYGNYSRFSYNCEHCLFDMDIECAELPIIESESEENHIQHFSHRHPLMLFEKMKAFDAHCQICEKICLEFIYGCCQCSFYLHKSCLDILCQKIQHLSHSCPLILLTTPSYQCDVCGKEKSGLTFCCGKCYFHLCANCFLISFVLPREMLHFLHPCPLILITSDFTCNVCYGNCSGFSYNCKNCHFDMDIECAQLPIIKSENEEKHIQHFSHRHPLMHLEETGDFKASCEICGGRCSELTYGCCQCNFYLHKSCMNILHQKMKSLFHPCPLILITSPSYQCESCNKMSSGLTFCCGKCYLHLCVECSMLPKKIQYFLHGHSLTLGEKKIADDFFCNACGACCTGLTYDCRECDFFLHKSCAELPQEDQHSFHPQHSLTLLDMAYQHSREVKCNLCLKDCNEFAFCCDECNFRLHIKCASLMPTVEYQIHNHLLTIVASIDCEVICRTCNKHCHDTPIFRCLECDFNLHLLCGPLPCTIKHKCHVDCLTLMDFYVEDDDDEFYCDACEQRRDPRLCVYYCAQGCPMICHVSCVISEVCLYSYFYSESLKPSPSPNEKFCLFQLRCLKLWPYLCLPNHQVIASLRGERGDVELRTVGRHIKSRVINKDLVKEMQLYGNTRKQDAEMKSTLSLNDIINSLNAFEKKILTDIVASARREVERSKALLAAKDDYTFAYSEENFRQLMERLHSANFNNLISDFISEHNEFITTGEFLVPQTLISIFENLFAKYGDISAESLLHPRVKSFFFFILCGVIQNMRTTTVVDVTEQKLCQWLACVKVANHAGFDVQFIFDHIKRIARAYFGLQAKKFIIETPFKKEQEIFLIAQEIKKLTEKSEAIKKQLQYHKTLVKSATSSLIKQCLNDATSMKWRPADYGLL